MRKKRLGKIGGLRINIGLTGPGLEIKKENMKWNSSVPNPLNQRVWYGDNWERQERMEEKKRETEEKKWEMRKKDCYSSDSNEEAEEEDGAKSASTVSGGAKSASTHGYHIKELVVISNVIALFVIPFPMMIM